VRRQGILSRAAALRPGTRHGATGGRHEHLFLKFVYRCAHANQRSGVAGRAGIIECKPALRFGPTQARPSGCRHQPASQDSEMTQCRLS
jgi:hypothetical protein